MGMISPPVGINVFIVKSIAPDVAMGEIFRGIWPFWFAMAFMILLLIIFPPNRIVSARNTGRQIAGKEFDHGCKN